MSYTHAIDQAVRPGHHPGTDDVYNMTALPRGITLIINNTFADHPVHGKHSIRYRSEEDVREVAALFHALGFDVHTKENLTRLQLLNELDSVASQDHSGYDCFVLWLMGHGNSGKVFCSDGLPIYIQSAQDMLIRCKTLKDKPKLFFIQACRDRGEDARVSVTSIDADPSNPPTHADFLYWFFNVDEHVSYSHEGLGNYFVRALVEAFRECAVHDDLMKILMKVMKKCAEAEIIRPAVENRTGRFMPFPELKSTLRKRVLLACVINRDKQDPFTQAIFYAYFHPDSQDVLCLICCPAHLRTMVIQELERIAITPIEGVSCKEMIPGHDKAFVFVSGGIVPVHMEDMKDFHLRLERDSQYKVQLPVRLVSDQISAEVEFHSSPEPTEKNLLCKLHLRLPCSKEDDRTGHSAETLTQDSSIPREIRTRGRRDELAYQKAMQSGKVKVFRGRIMLLGQARAGKTSLKKSLLGMPFDPKEESTIGIDPSECEVEIDQVKNWKPTEGKKPLESDAAEDIARLMAKDLNEAAVNQKDMHDTDSSSEPEQMPASLDSVVASVGESTPDITQESNAAIDIPGFNAIQSNNRKLIELDIDSTAPEDVTRKLVRYLEGLELEDEIKAKEAILTLWDFAGQHLYYASHSVFLSMRAVYVLVYNLSKSLSAEAEPCVRQGKHEILLDNPNNETNLDNLLSWLVSIHSIRPTEREASKDLNKQGANLLYLRPPVFIVGTNADQPSEDAKKMVKCIQKSISGKSYEKHVITSFFAVDNTKSQSDDGVQKLQKKIMEVLKREPYMGEEVPLSWLHFEKVVEKLVAKSIYHIALDQLLTLTRTVCHIDDEEGLTAMLNFYHDLGVIVKHGQTVVLQAQWLIDLFKQLITVRPYDEEENALYSECWNELEESGLLRITLVDHVFTDFIQKGLNKQDILDMMELYGLITKFPCLSSEDELEQKYLVPAQLRSSPSGLCKIQPSQSDPCPLYLHFLDGFVPHGLFSQLVSKCMSFCSEHGLKLPPQLYNNGARFFVGMQATFALVLICRKRFIKVILKKRNPSSARSTTTAATAKMAGEVRAFLEASLQSLSCDLSWLRNLRYEVCVSCTYCLQSGDQCTKHKSMCCSSDDCLHLLKVLPGEDLICLNSFCDEAIKVDGLEMWFQVQKVKTEGQKVKKSTPEESTSLDQPQPLTSSSLSSDDLLLLAFELGELDTSWKMLGRVLRLPEPVLEQIEEVERNLVDKCYSVLRRWTETFGSDATYQCLARGLQHPIVGRPRLAAKYCDGYRETFVGDFVNQRRYEQAARVSPSTSLEDSVPHGEDKPSDQVLNKVARHLCAHWQNLGLELQVPDPKIQEILVNGVLYPTMQQKAYQVLKAWKNRGKSVTYDELCRALTELGLNELAESLRKM